jgi:hypothetical protein
VTERKPRKANRVERQNIRMLTNNRARWHFTRWSERNNLNGASVVSISEVPQTAMLELIYECVYLFIYLFNDAVIRTDYIARNYGMISE